MAKESMKPFYNSTSWRTVRQRALMRDLFTCQICGARATEVHHIIEINEGNINNHDVSLSLENLQSLCHDCHTRITVKEHRGAEPDSGIEFYFDKDGMIRPYLPPGR